MSMITPEAAAAATQASWPQLLQMVLEPNTAAVAAATREVMARLKQPETRPVLVATLRSNEAPLRQLSAVLMRRRMVTWYAKMEPAEREALQAALLEQLTADPHRPTRHAVANLLSVVARCALPSNAWPTLLPRIFQLTQSQSADDREMALRVFGLLAEKMGAFFAQFKAEVAAVFIAGMQDSDERVKKAVIMQLEHLFGLLTEEDGELLAQLMGMLVPAIQWAIASGNDTEAAQGIEIFEALIESRMLADISEVIRFAMELATNKDIELSLREKAFDIVQTAWTTNPKTFAKRGFIQPTLEVLLAMLAEPSDDDEDDTLTRGVGDDEDDDGGQDETAYQYASMMIEDLASAMPPKHILKPLLAHAQQTIAAENPWQRRAAITSLGQLAEYYSLAMCDRLDALMAIVYTGVADKHWHVRKSAYATCCRFARFLQPDMAEQHAKLMPLLVGGVQEPQPQCRITACRALEAFVEHLDDNLPTYLDGLVSGLTQLLEQADDMKLQQAIISTLGTTSSAAGKDFAPFFAALLEKMLTVVRAVDSDASPLMPLRRQATECIGLMAIAVGREHVSPDMCKALLGIAFEGLTKLNDVELREFTYLFCSNLSHVMQDDFQPYLGELVPLVLASIDSSAGINTKEVLADGDIALPDDADLGYLADSGADAPATTIEDEGEGDDAELERADAEGGPRYSLRLRRAYLDEKAAAIECLGSMGINTREHFLPHMGKALEAIQEMIIWIYSPTRAAAYNALSEIARGVFDTFPPAGMALVRNKQGNLEAKWEKGVVVQCQQQGKEILGGIMRMFVEALMQEEDREVASKAMSCLVEVLDHTGPSIVEPAILQKIQQYVVEVMRREAACQGTGEEFEEEEEQELSLQMFDTAMDVVVQLAKCYGEHALLFYQQLWPMLEQYLGERSPSDSYRASVIGTHAEAVLAFENAAAQFITPAVLPQAVEMMKSDDHACLRNAAFCIGVCCQFGGEAALQHYNTAMPALVALASDEDTYGDIRENAAGALARMMLPHGTEFLEKAEVPVANLVALFCSLMPMHSDVEPHEPILQWIFQLLRASHPAAVSTHFGALVSLFGQLLGKEDYEVKEAQQAEMVMFLKAAAQMNEEAFKKVLEGVDEEPRANIVKFLSQ